LAQEGLAFVELMGTVLRRAALERLTRDHGIKRIAPTRRLEDKLMADQGSEGRLSPFLRRQRFKQALRFLRPDARVLDFGCGSGHLAAHVSPDKYVGVDVDDESRRLARRNYPLHVFKEDLPPLEQKFDLIIALAVLEHVPGPGVLLGAMGDRLKDAESRIVCTTPHPSLEWVHDVGARVGLFSSHASEEHEELLDRAKLGHAAAIAHLALVQYQRFLFGANQLVVYARTPVVWTAPPRSSPSVVPS
jgi:SAM-dependent methyltransferase